MAQHLLTNNNKGVEPNIADNLPGKASLTPTIRTTSPNGCDPHSVGSANRLLEKQISWVHRTWKNVCKAMPKHGFLCANEGVEPELHIEETSSDVKCCHQSKLEVLPSFERHILLCMSSKQLLREHKLLDADNKTMRCNCAGSVRPHVGGDDSDEVYTSQVGIFLQAYAKDGANLAHRLMDGTRVRRPLHTLAFARLWGEPGGMIHANAFQSDSDFDEAFEPQLYKESHESPFTILRRISMNMFKERIMHAVSQHQTEYPDKEMLDSVQDFFLYTEFEGRQVFEELDRDDDGKLTIDDVKLAMKKMKLPAYYAKDFMQSKHGLWPKMSFRWSEFSSMIQEKEPLIIQLFNSLGVSKAGSVSKLQLKDSLKKVGLSASDAHVSAMMKFLAADTDDAIKYGQFRRFMLLLPIEQLSTNPWNVWLKAATTVGTEPSNENFQASICKYILSLTRMGAKQERFESEAIPC